jgi:nucleoid-associated protein YgaU
MAARDKYQSALGLLNRLGAQNVRVEDDPNTGGVRLWATVDNQYEKDQIWNAIKSTGGDSPSDIVADIQVSNSGYYARHTVASGESLSKIAKHYYGDMMDYNRIYDANRDQLSDPDKIEVGQSLIIPNR